MALAQDISHNPIINTALPYDVTGNPISTVPVYVGGLNVLTSYKQFAERRPGFEAFESAVTTFTGDIRRLFIWQRWGADFYAMLNEVSATQSIVYKFQIGTDSSFSSIHTSSSTEPFDFVVSNNHVFFGNGADMQKWDATTVTGWGITSPAVAPTVATSGTGITAVSGFKYVYTYGNAGTGHQSSPSDTSASTGSFTDDQVDVTVVASSDAQVDEIHIYRTTDGGGGIKFEITGSPFTNASTGATSAASPSTAAGTDWPGPDSSGPDNAKLSNNKRAWFDDTTQVDLRLTNFSLAIPTGATILGIEVRIEGTAASATAAQRQIRVGLTKDGTALAGTRKTGVELNEDIMTPLVTSTATIGATRTIGNNGLSMVVNEHAGRYVRITENGAIDEGEMRLIASNTATLLTSDLNEPDWGFAINDAFEVVPAGTDTTLTEGSSSDLWGTTWTKAELEASTFGVLIGDNDATAAELRIDHVTVIVYTSYADTTEDADLSSTVSPTSLFNDPPPAARGFVWYANRIWMFVDNKIHYTGWEEIVTGVEEESLPSGLTGNFWAIDSQVTGLGVSEDGVLVFRGGRIYKIEGDSQDTFRLTKFVDRLGLRERATISSYARLTAWLDVSDSVWITDGFQVDELGIPIRSDLKGIDHSQSSMTFHADGEFRWLCLLDGAKGRLRVYDFQLEQWMPPWTVGGRCVASWETSAGVFDLLVGHSSHNLLQLNPNTFEDDGTAYNANLKTNLFDIVPSQRPGGLAVLEYVSYEHNSLEPQSVSALTDDDPLTGSYQASSDVVDVPQRTNGVALVERWAYFRKPKARRASIRFDWSADSNNFRLYSFDLAHLVTN